MKINRSILLDELTLFCQDGSGIIVGKPGVGKSYMLKQLRKVFIDKKILSLLIRIDNLIDASDNSISEQLEIEGNWLTILQDAKPKDSKAVLIFDAFDAARNDIFRREILQQIRKAKAKLSDSWNIVVSVRQYDALKSVELLRLFPLDSANTISNEPRKFEIPELTFPEIRTGEYKAASVVSFFEQADIKVQNILRVPFFLTLIEELLVLENTKNQGTLSTIKSESEMLHMFWQRKIVHAENSIEMEKFLHQFTNDLIESKSLSISKNQVLSTFSQATSEVWEYLKREDIIEENSFAKSSRIAFAHNILFDYAVRYYCIETNLSSFVKFVEMDKSRPFFYRPSFVYFFSDLWYEARPEFWNLFKQLSNSKDKEIILFVRLTINTTIVSEYESIHELDVILTESRSIEWTRNLLQAMQFIRTDLLKQDLDLLLALSERLQLQFLFEFAALAAVSVGQNPDNPIVGRICRNMLSHILENRINEHGQFYDRIGAYRGVELVAKTYRTDIPSSRDLLNRVLQLITEPGFDIGYIANLTEYLEAIAPYDPAFVAIVYGTLFSYKETSDSKTSLGGSVVMNLLSNRRQDYELCLFRLEQFFPSFLRIAPEPAITVGAIIVNNKYGKENQENQKYDLIGFKGVHYPFIADRSVVFTSFSLSEKEERLSKQMIEYFESLREGSKKGILRLIEFYITKAKTALLWKNLLIFLAKNADLFFQDFKELVFNETFWVCSDTIYEIRQLIFDASKHSLLTNDDIGRLEEMVFATYGDRDEPIVSALSVLPVERLQSERARVIMSQHETVKNEPLVKTSTSVRPYSREEYLIDQGVDLGDTNNASLNILLSQLESFNNKYLNSIPNSEEIKSIFGSLSDAFAKALGQQNISERLLDFSFQSIAKTASTISRNLDSLTDDQASILRQIALHCYNIESEYDRVTLQQTSPSSGYSPTAKTEAASALIPLFVRQPDIELRQTIEKAVNGDNRPARFNAIYPIEQLWNTHYKFYFQLLYDRLEKETDGFIASFLLSLLHFKKETLEDDALIVIKAMSSKLDIFKANNNFLRSFTEFLLWCQDFARLKPVAYEILENSITFPEFSQTVLFVMYRNISERIKFVDLKEVTQMMETAARLSITFVDRTFTQLKNFNFKAGDTIPEDVANAIKLLDEIVLRIYFCIEPRETSNARTESPGFYQLKEIVYFKLKPIFEKILTGSENLSSGSFLLGHTAHYFFQSLSSCLSFDPKDILQMVRRLTDCAISGGYTLDSFSIKEVVRFTEKLLADHREILLDQRCFQDLLSILDVYINSGWIDALRLLWRLDDIFK